MSLDTYKKNLRYPLRPRTVTFLIRDDNVLLGLKKRGFGKGNYLGIGGKVEDKKDKKSSSEEFMSIIKNGAIREIEEEIGVVISQNELYAMGELRFYFPHVIDETWNQEVYVFVARKWKGEPQANKDTSGEIEIEPRWFNKSHIPLDQMWDDAKYWLPKVLQGEKVSGEFLFDSHLLVIDFHVRSIHP